jgi:hypothetical protein
MGVILGFSGEETSELEICARVECLLEDDGAGGKYYMGSVYIVYSIPQSF